MPHALEGRKHPPDCGHCAWSRLPKPERQKRKTAKTLRGHGVAETTRAKLRAANLGKVREQSGSWINDPELITYQAIHQRLHKVLPQECVLADGTCKGRLDVALRHPARGRRQDDQGRWFSPYEEDYWRVCRSHHRRADYANGTPLPWASS